MPQTVSYQVTVGLRSGTDFETAALSTRVPDTAMLDVVEKELHDRMMAEWHGCLATGKPFDLERVVDLNWNYPHRVAVAADDIAWLATSILSIEPEREAVSGS